MKTGTHLTAGKQAPDFSGYDQDGKLVSLSDYKNKKLILFFYPRDNTPTCTKEVCNLRDNYELLRQNGFELLGVSTDDEKSHRKFIAKYELPFPLLADVNHKIVNAYGVYGEKLFFGRIIEGVYRSTFVIDEKGRLLRVFDKVKSAQHAEQILESLAEG